MYKKFAVLLDKSNKTAYQVSKRYRDCAVNLLRMEIWKN